MHGVENTELEFSITAFDATPESIIVDEKLGEGSKSHESNTGPQEESIGGITFSRETVRTNKSTVVHQDRTDDTVDNHSGEEEGEYSGTGCHETSTEEGEVPFE
jgi:hypothetical protein